MLEKKDEGMSVLWEINNVPDTLLERHIDPNIEEVMPEAADVRGGSSPVCAAHVEI